MADEEDLMMVRNPRRSSVFRLVALATVLSIVLGAVVIPRSITSAQNDALSGDYTVAINSEEIPTDVANAEMVVGRWRVSFQDGNYEAERLDLGVLIEGSYEVDGDTVTITDEAGIVSCANPVAAADGESDVSVATYRFDRADNRLTFVPEEDGCGLRRILLSSKAFQVFVPCLTERDEISSEASPQTDDEQADVEPEATETPETKGASPLDVLAINATPIGEEEDEALEEASLEIEIDGLLGQLTACWATGDPARFLPLWSQDFRDAFLSGTDDQNNAAIGSLRAAMQIPITWERAGDVELVAGDVAEAVVRTTTLDEQEFVRYVFVFEDGAWRWDGATG